MLKAYLIPKIFAMLNARKWRAISEYTSERNEEFNL